MKKQETNINALLANTILEGDDEYTLIKTFNRLRRHPTANTLRDDGYHPTDLGAELVAKCIIEQLPIGASYCPVTRPNQRTEQKQKTENRSPQTIDTAESDDLIDNMLRNLKRDILTTEQTQLDPDMTPHVVGKQGRNIDEVQKRFAVTISIDENIATIKGEKTKVTAAAAHLLWIQEEKRTEVERIKKLIIERQNIECEYFVDGNCKYGSECHFKHSSPNPPAWRTERNRSRGRGRGQRGRSRSRPAQPDVYFTE